MSNKSGFFLEKSFLEIRRKRFPFYPAFFRMIGLFLFLIFGFVIISCSKDSENTDPPEGTFNPTPYDLIIPQGFPTMIIPEDNPMTIEGVDLGRLLFYDPILSCDDSQSCADCHAPAFAFTDNGKQFSTGIDGEEGNRNSMAVINVGWMGRTFWDGRANGVEGQALGPVPNPIEMNLSWPEAMDKLNADDNYPDLFFNAFGIRKIDSLMVVKAIAQFERTLISSNSKWDKYLRGEVQITQAEAKGFEIFFTEKGDCFHCHSTILFTDNLFHNNGLDTEFSDKGLFDVSQDPNDIGKFKSPTLRNIELTAPYMHDGRFATLEDVLEFYSHDVQFSPTIDPLMKKVEQGGIQLTDEEKENLIAFLKTLTDTTFVNNPDFADPF